MKFCTFACFLVLLAPALQAQRPAKTTYSNMFVHPETGDILGWDIRFFDRAGVRSIVLFCGEGVPLGPVRAPLVEGVGLATFQPGRTDCGKKFQLKIGPKFLRLQVHEGPWERIRSA